jgi:hypothetical protein
MISLLILDAVDQLTRLRVGQKVRVTLDGRDHEMVVTRPARRSDGAHGSVESTRVTVSFGPGRYATEVTAERLAAGTQALVTL